MSVIEREQAPAEIQAPVTERDLLRRAADVLEEWGWCQHTLAVDDNGPFDCNDPDYLDRLRGAGQFCVNGAMFRAILDLGGDPDMPLGRALRELVGQPPYIWNDKPERTKAGAVLALREAAERA